MRIPTYSPFWFLIGWCGGVAFVSIINFLILWLRDRHQQRRIRRELHRNDTHRDDVAG
jgi:hypothetical protein